MNNPDNPNLVELWPVTFIRRKLDDHERINRELIALFRDYQARHPRKGPGYISPDTFANDLDDPPISTLKQFLMDGVYEISMALNARYWQQAGLKSLDVNVTGLWFQISNDYTFHETHVHGNCSWSGVYYVQAGDSSRSAADRGENGMPNGITRFYGPEMEYSAGGHGDWGNYYLHHNSYTSYPEDGVALIFPSHIKHAVFPYSGKEDRIIVSFHAQVNSDSAVSYAYSND